MPDRVVVGFRIKVVRIEHVTAVGEETRLVGHEANYSNLLISPSSMCGAYNRYVVLLISM